MCIGNCFVNSHCVSFSSIHKGSHKGASDICAIKNFIVRPTCFGLWASSKSEIRRLTALQFNSLFMHSMDVLGRCHSSACNTVASHQGLEYHKRFGLVFSVLEMKL